jgi:hypothetical protein
MEARAHCVGSNARRAAARRVACEIDPASRDLAEKLAHGALELVARRARRCSKSATRLSLMEARAHCVGSNARRAAARRVACEIDPASRDLAEKLAHGALELVARRARRHVCRWRRGAGGGEGTARCELARGPRPACAQRRPRPGRSCWRWQVLKKVKKVSVRCCRYCGCFGSCAAGCCCAAAALLLLLRCCCAAAALLLRCCCAAQQPLLLRCCCAAAALLLRCAATAAAALAALLGGCCCCAARRLLLLRCCQGCCCCAAAAAAPAAAAPAPQVLLLRGCSCCCGSGCCCCCGGGCCARLWLRLRLRLRLRLLLRRGCQGQGEQGCQAGKWGKVARLRLRHCSER